MHLYTVPALSPGALQMITHEGRRGYCSACIWWRKDPSCEPGRGDEKGSSPARLPDEPRQRPTLSTHVPDTSRQWKGEMVPWYTQCPVRC